MGGGGGVCPREGAPGSTPRGGKGGGGDCRSPPDGEPLDTIREGFILGGRGGGSPCAAITAALPGRPSTLGLSERMLELSEATGLP